MKSLIVILILFNFRIYSNSVNFMDRLFQEKKDMVLDFAIKSDIKSLEWFPDKKIVINNDKYYYSNMKFILPRNFYNNTFFIFDKKNYKLYFYALILFRTKKNKIPKTIYTLILRKIIKYIGAKFTMKILAGFYSRCGIDGYKIKHWSLGGVLVYILEKEYIIKNKGGFRERNSCWIAIEENGFLYDIRVIKYGARIKD